MVSRETKLRNRGMLWSRLKEGNTSILRADSVHSNCLIRLTMHDLGPKMGYPENSARKSAWQFLGRRQEMIYPPILTRSVSEAIGAFPRLRFGLVWVEQFLQVALSKTGDPRLSMLNRFV